MIAIDKNLLQLIENMSGINDTETPIGSNTISWNAYQIAREINDLSLVPQLLSFLYASDDVKQKKHAYQLLLFILTNTNDNSLADQLLKQIKKEDQNDDCLYTLLIGLWESKTAMKNHIEDVIFYIDDQRELIRNAAIRLLGSYENDLDIAEDALIEIVNYPYDNFDLKYAVESLAKIGSVKSIDTLKKSIEETEDQEVKEVIFKTIEKLKSQQR